MLLVKGGRQRYEATDCHPVEPFKSSTRVFTTAGGLPQLMGLQEGASPDHEPSAEQTLKWMGENGFKILTRELMLCEKDANTTYTLKHFPRE